jgi:hypothetical protein
MGGRNGKYKQKQQQIPPLRRGMTTNKSNGDYVPKKTGFWVLTDFVFNTMVI